MNNQLQLEVRILGINEAIRSLIESGCMDDYRGRNLLRELLAAMLADIDEFSLLDCV